MSEGRCNTYVTGVRAPCYEAWDSGHSHAVQAHGIVNATDATCRESTRKSEAKRRAKKQVEEKEQKAQQAAVRTLLEAILAAQASAKQVRSC